jgi:hypothetical protein
MIELLFILSILLNITIAVIAAYLWADNKSDKRFIGKQDVWIKDLKNEVKELYGKLLLKQGISPVGYKPTPKDPKPDRDVTREPNVVMRHQAAERATPKDDILVKAKQIIDLRTDT